MQIDPATLSTAGIVNLAPFSFFNAVGSDGRVGSPSVYCRTTDRFDLARMGYAEAVAQVASTTTAVP